jgi:FAD/FMN-containing dehydrogenase
MSRAIFDFLAASLGDAVTRGADGLPRVAPQSTDAVAAALGLANEKGLRIRVEGRGTWMPPDAPADLALTTERLDRVTAVAPLDLVATAEAGVPFRELETALARQQTWLAVDPPGSPNRTLGSVLATGTAGPARHRFGPVRDHVLGTTVATADGKLVRSGGIVVKNVAGYDLSKVQIGGFGGFGVITEVNLRLRALPAAWRLFRAEGDLDPLFHAGRAIVAADIDATVVELVCFGHRDGKVWQLVVEIAGTESGVEAEVARAEQAVAPFRLIPADRGAVGAELAAAAAEGPVTIRAGALPGSAPDTVELVGETLGKGWIGIGLGRGGLRWSGSAGPDRLRRLRHRLAEREIPLTLERAPWAIRAAVGHFGAFREGVLPLTTRVRAVFDPAGILVAPLEEATGA